MGVGGGDQEGSLLPNKGLKEVNSSQFSPAASSHLNWGECKIQLGGVY